MIGHRVGQRQADEAPEAQPVRERLLEPGVGQAIPLLQQQALEQHHRTIRRPPDRRRVDPAERSLERGPVDQGRDPLQLPVAPRAALDQPVRQRKLPELPPHPRLPCTR
jgi:hypothetical protein